MNENSLVNFFEKQTITSLELLEEINFFREKEGNNKASHRDLMVIIETEFADINRKRVKGGMSPGAYTQIEEQLKKEDIEISYYINPQNSQTYKMYILPVTKAKQCLLKESKFVRKSVIHRLEELEQKEQLQLMEVPRYIAELETKLKTTVERLETLEKIINKRIPLMVNAELRKRETAQRKANIKEIKKKIVEIVDSKKNRRTAWEKLYKVFSKKYNIDLEKEFIKCVGVYNTKHLTKIEFITTRLKMLNELYEVAKTL